MKRALHLAAILPAALVAGCATTVHVVVDEGQQLAPYRTWAWAPRAHQAVDAPQSDSAQLDAELAQHIEERLRENGFERTDGRAEFLVSYRLTLRQQSVVVSQPRASYQLDSHHSQGSFVVEGSDRVTRVYTEVRLAIAATEAQGRTLWRAELVRQAEAAFGSALGEAVDAVLARFPQHRAASDAGAPPPVRCGGAAVDGKPAAGPADAEGAEPLGPPAPGCPPPGRDLDPPKPPDPPGRALLPA